MKLAWLTDIHLDHLWPRRDKGINETPERVIEFFEEIASEECDATIISGDIAISHHFFIPNYFLTTEYCIRELRRITNKPVYFILGNHDYYFGSIATIRADMRALSRTQGIRWLTNGNVVEITPKVAMIGHDGWYDMRNGDPVTSIVMSEFEYVKEFDGYRRDFNIAKKLCQKLADEAATYFTKVLPIVFESYEKVILLTHVPPFAEVSRYRGLEPSNANSPYYSSKSIGDALLEISNNCSKNGKRALSSLSCAGVQFTWTRCCRLSAAEEHRSVCILPVLQTISRDSE